MSKEIVCQFDGLIENIDSVAQLLEDFVKGKIIKPRANDFENKVKLVIAKRWNSWYPCYYNTMGGGCYAIITRDKNEDVKENSGVIVIDPGVDFSSILRENYDIEPNDIKSVLVSHHHPDHTMGLYELFTITRESEYPCKFFMNRSTYKSFKIFQGKNNKIFELADDQIMRISKYKYNDVDLDEEISLTPIKVFHEEIGERHNSLGFKIKIITEKGNGIKDDIREILFLGDTDGNEKYIDLYLNYLKDADIAVLHLGSFTNKGYGRGNKHLYKSGLINIINCINCIKGGPIYIKDKKIEECKFHKLGTECEFKERNYFNRLKLVIISELGLELASSKQLVNSFEGFKWFTRLYPLMIFLKFFNEKDDYVKSLNGDGEFSKKFAIPLNLLATKAMYAIVGLLDCNEKFFDVKGEENLKKISALKLLKTKREIHHNKANELYNFSVIYVSMVYGLALSTNDHYDSDKWTEMKLKRDEPELLEKIDRLKNELEKIKVTSEEEIKKRKILDTLILHYNDVKNEFNDKTNEVRILELSRDVIPTKLELIYQYLGSIPVDEYNGLNYEDFIKKFDEDMLKYDLKDFVSWFEEVNANFFGFFLKNVIMDSLGKPTLDEQLRSNILIFSKAIYESLEYAERNDKQFKNFLSAAKSLSLFSGDIEKIWDLVNKKDFWSYENPEFDALLLMLSFALYKWINSAKTEDIGTIKSKNFDACLSNIMQQYSKGEVKYFLSNLGMELDLSYSAEFKIKNWKNEWITLPRAKQDNNLNIVNDE